jgi:hypothetical protein
MEKLDIALISLAVIFVFMLGFVVNNLYFNDRANEANKINAPSNEPKTNPPVKNTTQAISLGTDISSCINNTEDNPQCKDCCDCLSGIDGETRTACRDTCAVHDFSKNTNLITITVPSILGLNGDYSQCVAKGATECKTCCESSIGLSCGDYQYCRTACNNAFGDAKHNISASTP